MIHNLCIRLWMSGTLHRESGAGCWEHRGQLGLQRDETLPLTSDDSHANSRHPLALANHLFDAENWFLEREAKQGQERLFCPLLISRSQTVCSLPGATK